MPLRKIVSGGQTGVDRGALDAALEAGFPCGGWCPPGRAAEDGPIPERYPLQEIAQGGSLERTIANVTDSDGTLVLHFGPIRGGTERTVFHCGQQRKPCLLIDGETSTPEQAVVAAAAFVAEHDIAVLNVAGPRASQAPRAWGDAHDVVSRLLRRGPS